MRQYEIVYIFRPETESEEVEDRLDGFHERLDGEVTAVEHWGQRELAYEIEGERRGYYAVAQFRAEPGSLPEFEQALDLDRDLVRHLLVLSEGEVPTPPSRRREEEDEEEDREEEEAAEEGEAEEQESEEDEGAEEDDREDEGADDKDEDDADDREYEEPGPQDESGEDEEPDADAADETDDEDEER